MTATYDSSDVASVAVAPGVPRELARRDLELALLCWADWKWAQERQNGWATHPAHWKARTEWVRAHHLDLGKARPVTG